MKEKEKDLIKCKNRFHISFPLLMDENALVGNAYGVSIYPETFFINREGKIVGRVLGIKGCGLGVGDHEKSHLVSFKRENMNQIVLFKNDYLSRSLKSVNAE